MNHLPDWTNNRFVVGLILAWYTTLLGVFSGIFKWHIPIWAGIAFGTGIYIVISPLSLIDIVKRISRAVGNVLAITLAIIGIGVVCTAGFYFIITIIVLITSGGSLTINAPLLVPIIFYILILTTKMTTSYGFVNRNIVLEAAKELIVAGLYVVFVMMFFFPVAPKQYGQLQYVLLFVLLNMLAYIFILKMTEMILRFNRAVVAGGAAAFELFIAVTIQYINIRAIMYLFRVP